MQHLRILLYPCKYIFQVHSSNFHGSVCLLYKCQYYTRHKAGVVVNECQTSVFHWCNCVHSVSLSITPRKCQQTIMYTFGNQVSPTIQINLPNCFLTDHCLKYHISVWKDELLLVKIITLLYFLQLLFIICMCWVSRPLSARPPSFHGNDQGVVKLGKFR